ncbi:MAG: hypothetical protein WBE22_08865 [Halobacteriota archaeon]
MKAKNSLIYNFNYHLCFLGNSGPFAHSFKYQDIGKVIESIEFTDGDCMIQWG